MNSFPLISVRDIVIFPGGQNTLIIGRSFSLETIKECLSKFEGKIVITSQKFIEMNDRPTMDQIFNVGCLCQITNMVEFPDGSMKISVQGEHRFKIESIIDNEEVRLCNGEALSDKSKDESLELIMQIGALISTRTISTQKRTLDQIREGVFLIDTLTVEQKKLVNNKLVKVQELLEGDASASLKKIEAILT